MTLVFGITVILTAVTVAVLHFRREGGASLPGWFLLSSVVFVNIGFLTYYVRAGADEAHWTAQGVVVTSTGLLTVTATTFLLMRSAEAFQLADRPARRRSDESTSRLLILAVGLLAPAWLYFYLLGSVPLFDGVTAVLRYGADGLGELQAARLARDPYASSGRRIPMQGALQVFRNLGAPIVFSYALVQLINGARRRPRIVVMAVALATSLAAGQRWPLLYLGLAALIAIGASSTGFPRKLFVRVGLVIAAIGVLISALQARTLTSLTGLRDALVFGTSDLLERAMVDQVYVPALSYGPAGDVFRFMYGDSYYKSLLSYLPGPGTSFPVDFYTEITGDRAAYTAAPDFYTEAYLNFGLLGVVVLSVLWALALVNVGTLIRRSTTPETIAITSTLGAVLALSAFAGAIFTLSVFIVAYVAYALLKVHDVLSPRHHAAAAA